MVDHTLTPEYGGDSVPQPDAEQVRLLQIIAEKQRKIDAFEEAARAKRGEKGFHYLPPGAPPKAYTLCARAAIESGATYLYALWSTALDTVHCEGPISEQKAQAIAKAVSREFRKRHGNAPHERAPKDWWESVQERGIYFLKWAIDTSELRHSSPKKLTSAANRLMLRGVVSYN